MEDHNLSLHPAAAAMVQQLIGTVYGNSEAEVIRSLVTDKLKELAFAGVVPWARSTTAFNEHLSSSK